MSEVGTIGATATDAVKSSSTDFLKQLRERHPDLQIRTGTVKPEFMRSGELEAKDIPAHGAGDGNVLIDSRYIEKMRNDPEIAKEGDEILSGIPAADREMRDRFASGDMELLDHGTVIDKDGNIAGWCSVRTRQGDDDEKGGGLIDRLSGGDDDKKKTDKKKAAKAAAERAREELERVLARRAEAEAGATIQAGKPLDISV